MGKVKKRIPNPKIPENIMNIYLDMESSYINAQNNIKEFGEVTSHPRTGEPMANPYLSVREKASKQMIAIQHKYRRFSLFI